MSEMNKKARRKQLLLVGGISALCLAVGYLAMTSTMGGDETSSNSKKAQRYAPKPIVEAGTKALSDEDFMEQVNTRLGTGEATDRRIEKTLETMSATLKAIQEEKIAQEHETEDINALQKKYDGLKLEFEQIKSEGGFAGARVVGGVGAAPPSQVGNDPFARRGGGVADTNPNNRPPSGLTKKKVRITGLDTSAGETPLKITRSFGSSSSESGEPSTQDGEPEGDEDDGPKLSKTKAPSVYDTEDYVPANAYANATVIMGADASTGVTSSSDPLPILMRITSAAYHVFDEGMIQETDLSGCMVNGSARGDLSSEKVLINLQVITCPNGDGTVSENKVSGFVAHLGKGGVRGPVVNRSGELLKLAALSGFIGGIAQVAEQQALGRTGGFGVGVGGAGGILGQQQDLSTGEVARAGAFGGASGALNQLTEYAVNRMEQLQPIIEMPTGAEVDIFFLEGVQVRSKPKE